MSNPSTLFALEALHAAARRNALRAERVSAWQRLLQAWRSSLQRRRDAAAIAALSSLDDHQLRDIGASDELRARAAVLRERREHPFAPGSLRGIEVASRRSNW
jgi:uncharacterized protein YjiS (DUF1127 family)